MQIPTQQIVVDMFCCNENIHNSIERKDRSIKCMIQIECFRLLSFHHLFRYFMAKSRFAPIFIDYGHPWPRLLLNHILINSWSDLCSISDLLSRSSEGSYFANLHLAFVAPYDGTGLRYKIKNKNLSVKLPNTVST